MQQTSNHPLEPNFPPASGGGAGLQAVVASETIDPSMRDDLLDPVGSQMVNAAHDLSNLLSIALGNAGFTRREVGNETRAQRIWTPWKRRCGRRVSSRRRCVAWLNASISPGRRST